MKIQVLCDNPRSWMMPYANKIVKQLMEMGHEASMLGSTDEVTEGDILIMLSCETIFKKLNLNKHNLVAHASALPQGKGWSPLTWQIMEGKNDIPVTLFEAVEKVDAGVVYDQAIIHYNGNELIDELRTKMAEIIEELVLKFVKNYPDNSATEQYGESSFYPKRKPSDSKLDIEKSIGSQFNLFRVCDNEQYPAWFEKDGIKYILKIYKA